MKNLIKRIHALDKKEHCLNVVVETPKGSRNKYAYEPEIDLIALKRCLPEGMIFPFNFGFIPSTQGDDGDPLDILILNDETLFSGCALKVKLLGAIKAEQTEDGKTVRNDRLLGQALGKESSEYSKSIRIDDRLVKEIEHFFVSYNRLDGKKFRALGRLSPQAAREIIRRGAKKFRKENDD